MSHVSLLHAFGEVVLVHRRRRRLSQERLAERTGLSRNAIGQIERGESNPGLTTVFALAAALDLSPEALLADTHRLAADRPPDGGRPVAPPAPRSAR